MRLTPDEIMAIRDCASAVFGPGAVVRLFGSRVHDHLSGGDIDLLITADSDEPITFLHESRFKDALERRIGEQRIDVLVNGPGGPTSAIEKIALLTGHVLPEGSGTGPPALETDAEMLDALHRRLLSEALASGRKVRSLLGETMADIQPMLPFDAVAVDKFDRQAAMMTDSLMLQFSNLVAIVQDQLVRTILLAAGQSVDKRSRADQRVAVEALGAVPRGLAFETLANARNRLAHQYPAAPERQAAMLNEVVAAVPITFEAYDALEGYARKLLDSASEL